MEALFNRFWKLNIWVKVIFFFCLLGAFANLFLFCRDLVSGGVLLRLHLGFFILYVSQAVFILLEERLVFVLAVLQGILAFLTNADFTFAPLLRFAGGFYYAFNPVPSVEAMSVYKYVFISLAFTLQLLSAYALFSLLPKHTAPKKHPSSANSAGPASCVE